MKLQFSLATLLVCMTVLAIVCTVCAKINVVEQVEPELGTLRFRLRNAVVTVVRQPTASEAAWRVALWGPPAVVGTLAIFWAIRRLKSRRHTEPPVG